MSKKTELWIWLKDKGYVDRVPLGRNEGKFSGGGFYKLTDVRVKLCDVIC